ncbi:MAG: hypothetical protein CMH60_03020 [Myxococcales bacterium]|nr:hypothetical protein [Myxococcales bacterium]
MAVHELALGVEFSCVLFSNGRIGCWGNAGNGRLGRGDSQQIGDSNPDGENPYELYDDLVYVDLGDNGRAKEIVAGEKFACALLNNGGVKCWGDNSAGQLGLGDNVSRGTDPADMGNNLPAIDFGTTSVVEDVCAGDKHACVLFADDTMKCWGDNFAGQLGQGDTADRGDAAGEMGTDLPTVDLGAGFVPSKIDCAGQVSCAFGQGGVKCWGNNGYGQLGQGLSANIGDDPDEIGENLPAINLGTGVVAADVIAGPNNVCAMLDDGTIKCWGDQMFSQLYPGYGVGSFGNPIGDESDEMGDDLETYVLDDDVLQILHGALGRHEICVVMDTVYREIKCWGYLHSWPNDNTRGSNGHDAVFVPNTEAVVEKLFIGDNHAGGWVHGCALLQGGAVRCWGDNTSGQLGLGDTIARQVINGNFLPDLQLIAP